MGWRTGGCAGVRMDGRTGGRTDGRTDELADGLAGGRTNKQSSFIINNNTVVLSSTNAAGMLKHNYFPVNYSLFIVQCMCVFLWGECLLQTVRQL